MGVEYKQASLALLLVLGASFATAESVGSRSTAGSHGWEDFTRSLAVKFDRIFSNSSPGYVDANRIAHRDGQEILSVKANPIYVPPTKTNGGL